MTTSTTSDATWAVRHFATFWAAPDPAGDVARLADDIVGHWPDGVVRGRTDYRQRLAGILAVVPDLRLEVIEHAVNGDIAFIRWRATGTGPRGPVELVGVDRMRVDGDQIVENVVLFDTAAFAAALGAPLA